MRHCSSHEKQVDGHFTPLKFETGTSRCRTSLHLRDETFGSVKALTYKEPKRAFSFNSLLAGATLLRGRSGLFFLLKLFAQ
jgi:hypothetical protein